MVECCHLEVSVLLSARDISDVKPEQWACAGKLGVLEWLGLIGWHVND